MRAADRWAVYRWPDKVPRQLDGRMASSTDPATWTSWTTVRGQAHHGFMLGDGIGCIDIDHCLDAEGRLHPVVADLVAQLAAVTYIEVSPSGTGLHAFGYLDPGPGTRRHLGHGVSIEIYSRERFMTVTGKRWGNTSRLGELAGVAPRSRGSFV